MDFAGIKANLEFWKAKCKLEKPYGVHVADYVENVKNVTDLMEVSVTHATLNDED